MSGLAGNDTLAGGAGNDTYIFNQFDGIDVIAADASNYQDTVMFGTGLTTEMMAYSCIGNDLVFSFGNDSLKVMNWALGGGYKITQFYFGNEAYSISNDVYPSKAAEIINNGISENELSEGLDSSVPLNNAGMNDASYDQGEFGYEQTDELAGETFLWSAADDNAELYSLATDENTDYSSVSIDYHLDDCIILREVFDLKIGVQTGAELKVLTFTDWFVVDTANPCHQIENVSFSDGNWLTAEQLTARANAY